MDERTITVEIHGKPYEVYAGNAALRRYRKAGGSMNDLQNLDTNKGENSTDDILDALDSIGLLIYANLKDRGEMTLDDMFNGIPSMNTLADCVSELFSKIEWFTETSPGNALATGKGSK